MKRIRPFIKGSFGRASLWMTGTVVAYIAALRTDIPVRELDSESVRLEINTETVSFRLKEIDMADVHDSSTRSYNMSRISGKDTKPEMMVRKFLHGNGFRYRLHVKDLPGKPDLVLPKYNSVIFVHGCFWHAHEGCKYFKIPKTRTEWWKEKLYGNKERDEENIRELKEMGWNVAVVWSCELKSERETTLEKLINFLQSKA